MDELAKKIAELSEKYGPHVIDAARQAVRMDMYSNLVSTLMEAGAAGLLIYAGMFLWKKASTSDSYDAEMLYPVSWMLWAAAMIPACCAIWTWIDPWTWTAFANPDLYLAKRVFRL
jgi:hypothetical protein